MSARNVKWLLVSWLVSSVLFFFLFIAGVNKEQDGTDGGIWEGGRVGWDVRFHKKGR